MFSKKTQKQNGKYKASLFKIDGKKPSLKEKTVYIGVSLLNNPAFKNHKKAALFPLLLQEKPTKVIFLGSGYLNTNNLKTDGVKMTLKEALDIEKKWFNDDNFKNGKNDLIKNGIFVETLSWHHCIGENINLKGYEEIKKMENSQEKRQQYQKGREEVTLAFQEHEDFKNALLKEAKAVANRKYKKIKNVQMRNDETKKTLMEDSKKYIWNELPGLVSMTIAAKKENKVINFMYPKKEPKMIKLLFKYLNITNFRWIGYKNTKVKPAKPMKKKNNNWQDEYRKSLSLFAEQLVASKTKHKKKPNGNMFVTTSNPQYKDGKRHSLQNEKTQLKNNNPTQQRSKSMPHPRGFFNNKYQKEKLPSQTTSQVVGRHKLPDPKYLSTFYKETKQKEPSSKWLADFLAEYKYGCLTKPQKKPQYGNSF